MRYRLTADWNGQSDEVTFDADNSLEAVTVGIQVTLDRAWDGNPSPSQRLWAHGLIRLWSPRGEVLHTMPEKEVT